MGFTLDDFEATRAIREMERKRGGQKASDFILDRKPEEQKLAA